MSSLVTGNACLTCDTFNLASGQRLTHTGKPVMQSECDLVKRATNLYVHRSSNLEMSSVAIHICSESSPFRLDAMQS